MYLLPYGILIGLSIGIIIGPIAILCIRRSMIDGFLMGIATGLGASLAHLIFGSIAAFSLNVVKNMLITHAIWIRLLGSIYLIYLALKALTKNFSIENKQQKISYSSAIFSTFLLNLTNPVAITSYAAFLSMFNVSLLTITSGFVLLCGIFIGNFGWWIALSGMSSLLGSFSSKKILIWSNSIAALLLAMFGIIGIASALYTFFR